MDSAKYWDACHRAAPPDGVDWYSTGEAASGILHRLWSCLQTAQLAPRQLLHVGCGTSTLGDSLYAAYCAHAPSLRLLSLDFSAECITWQRARGGMGSFAVADIRAAHAVSEAAAESGLTSDEFDYVVDKGTLDSLLQHDSDKDARAAAVGALGNMFDALPLCGLGGSRSCSGKDVAHRAGLLAVISIHGPETRRAFFCDAVNVNLGMLLHGCPAEADAPLLGALLNTSPARYSVLETLRSPCGRAILWVIEIQEAPFEIPTQRAHYLYALLLR